MTEHIPIFCATDENYAPFASIMMKSVLMHTDAFIDFYIMDSGIQEKTKKLIDKDLRKYSNKKLHYVDMTKYELNQFPEYLYWTVSIYSRYFIPSICPLLSKAIYLDVDIIVKGDIRELYYQDLGNYSIGAVPEVKYFSICPQDKFKKMVYPDYQEGSCYFNSGVILMDIQKLIEMDFIQKATELTKKFICKLECPDQDVLNILFEKNYKQLDYRFNFLTYATRNFKKKCSEITSIDPVIIHYPGAKPWEVYCSFKEDFDEVLEQSVFYKYVIRKYNTQKISKFYLFGVIPLFEKIKKKPTLKKVKNK